MFTILTLAAGLALILGSCVVFTNAVEALGKQHRLGHGAVGSILAAVGTALPETVIPILALLFSRDEHASDVGIGAIAGAPFMLGTLGFAVTGAAVYAYASRGCRKFAMHADVRVFERDLSFFLVAYGLAVSCTFIPVQGVRVAAALALLGIYAYYIKVTLSTGKGDPAGVEPLYLLRVWDPGRIGPGLQSVIAVAGILAGARLFIDGVIGASAIAGISPLILSIIITPIATELPEKFNSVIWIGKKKDTLALGNITGAMVFQSCFPVAFGLVFSPWNLTGTTMVSAILALLSGAVNLVWIKRTGRVDARVLLACAALYLVLFAYMGVVGVL